MRLIIAHVFGVRSTEKIRRRGLEAMAEALGPVDAVRFLQKLKC